MNDLADDGFHEIQLSAKQLVFLVMAATTVAVAIFLCGVQVGRTVKSDRPIDGIDPLVSSAPPPAAAVPAPGVAAGGPPAAEPPAPAPEPDDELSYAKRLQGDQAAPPAEKLKAPSTATPPAPAQQAAAVNAASANAAAAKAASPPAADASASPNGGHPGAFIVQLTALQDRNAAMTIVRTLVAKGYPAFVQDPTPGSPAIFRVQVGGYSDRDKAAQAARRLEKEEQFKTYVRSR
jgi:type IV secretory pathway VirB10-like protein